MTSPIGLLGGALGTPTPKPGGDYADIRYADGQYTYTQIHVADQVRCPNCGELEAEVHTLGVRDESGSAEFFGDVRACRNCESEHWLFVSHMPATVAAREMAARVVP